MAWSSVLALILTVVPPPSVGTPVVPGAPHGSAGCTRVPKDVSSESVASAIARTPNLSTLAGAIGAAGLHDELGKAADVTVFAPADEALTAAALPTADLLRYHIVPQSIAPDRLAGTHPTLRGGGLEVSKRAGVYRVNGQASLICRRMGAANGNVYLIDTVLTPR